MIRFNPIDTKSIEPYYMDMDIIPNLGNDFASTFSGKSSISMIFRYLMEAGIIPDKSYHTMVPEWMGTWMYMMLNRYCMTTPEYTNKTKVLFAYHQWGFPQEMDAILEFCEDKHLILIEDCAHAIDSYYNGRRLGTFGLASIFSLSKFFACTVGGGIYTRDLDLRESIEDDYLFMHNDSLANEIVSGRKEFDEGVFDVTGRIDQHYAIYDRLSKIPDTSLALVKSQILGGAFERRARIYETYRKELGAMVYYMPKILPWVVPLFLARKISLSVALRKAKIESGIYHFDINRNMFDPDFQICVSIPCHHQMTDNDVDKVIEVVKLRV